MSTKIKIAIIVDKFSPAIGGPYFILKQTINSLKKIINIKLIFNDTLKSKKNLKLSGIIKNFDLIHLYGGWTYFHIKVALLAFKLKKKVIIHPLGYYEPWSLNQKKIKKKIAWNLYQKKILLKSDLIHCASRNEQKNLLKLNNGFKTFVLPYGIENSFIKKYKKKLKIKKSALFLSRIHKKKGIENLINAWIQINTKEKWTLDIMGPCNDENYLLKLKNIVRNNKNINFLKPMYSNKKKKILFNQYDFLVLPTFNENFGMVILESLARGLPVLTNCNTPWNNIENYNAGWFIGSNYEQLLSCLRKIFKSKINIFNEKSFNAIKLASNYSWNKLADDYVRMYKGVLKND
jgi:glycosyltransferase involved in cell wall biosynthesis